MSYLARSAAFAVAILALLHIVWTTIKRRLADRYCAVADIEETDKPAVKRSGCAVVVGASIAGILAGECRSISKGCKI